MIGENIANIRKEKSLSQRELARRIDMSGQMISKIENNLSQPSMHTLRKIADALGVSVYDLTMDSTQQKEDVKVIECMPEIESIAERFNIDIKKSFDDDGDGEYLQYVYIAYESKEFRLTGAQYEALCKRITESVIINILASDKYK